jgi:hypothetical protein
VEEGDELLVADPQGVEHLCEVEEMIQQAIIGRPTVSKAARP